MTEKVSFYCVGNVFHVVFRAEGLQTAPKPVPHRIKQFNVALSLKTGLRGSGVLDGREIVWLDK